MSLLNIQLLFGDYQILKTSQNICITDFLKHILSVLKNLFTYKRLSLTSGGSVSYIFGGEINGYYNQSGPEMLYAGAGIDLFTNVGLKYMKGLSINPTFNFHLNPKKKYNMFTFIVLFGFDF